MVLSLGLENVVTVPLARSSNVTWVTGYIVFWGCSATQWAFDPSLRNIRGTPETKLSGHGIKLHEISSRFGVTPVKASHG